MGMLLAACGGQAPAVSTPASTAPSASAAASDSASGAVSSLDAVKTATIQIEAEGTFQDPEVGTGVPVLALAEPVSAHVDRGAEQMVIGIEAADLLGLGSGQ